MHLPGAPAARRLAPAAAAVLALTMLGAPAAEPRTTAAAPAFVRHLLSPGPYSQVVESVGVGDLDGDRRPDIVVAGDRYLLWYRNPAGRPRLIARGTFGSGAMVVIRDVDGDRRPDVVTGQRLPDGTRLEVWFSRTAGGWRRHVLSSDAYCHDLAFAQILPGRRPDAACVDQHHRRIVVLVPRPAAPWSQRIVTDGRASMGLAVADVDRDGRLDLVAGQAWYRNGGDGTWTRYPFATFASSAYPDFDDFSKLAVVDLDRDGRPDVVASVFAESPAGRLYAFIAPADPREPSWRAVLLDQGPLFGVHSIAVGRFDGCARPEVVIAETNIGGWDFGPAPDPHVYLYRLLTGPDGRSSWSRSTVDSVGAHDVQAADLNRDGLPDLVGHEENTDLADPPRDGRVFWWQNVGPRSADGCG